MPSNIRLQRTTFSFSRALEYFNAQELQAQTGQPVSNFLCVVLKELIDNALDSCERQDIAPQIEALVNQTDSLLQIKVSDNGKGMPPDTVERILDFNTRTTDKAFYRTPTRGQMGNALKTILGMPFALSKDSASLPVVVRSQGIQHTIGIRADPIGELKVNYEREEIKDAPGTTFIVSLPLLDIYTVYWPEASSLFLGYGMFNPHADLMLTVDGNTIHFPPLVRDDWRKFGPADLPSPHWFDDESLKRLIFAFIGEGRHNGRDLTLREFLTQFRGLSSTQKVKEITDAFPEIRRLSDFEQEEAKIPSLLCAVKSATRPPSPSILGLIGEKNLKQRLTELFEVEKFWYSCKKDTYNELPYVVEVAAAKTGQGGRVIISGLNFSPTYGDPFRSSYFYCGKEGKSFYGNGISGFLQELKVTPEDNFMVMVHLTCPHLDFMDRAKSNINLSSEMMSKISQAIYSCCYEHYEYKRRMERDAAREKREQRRRLEEKVIKNKMVDCVLAVMPEAVRRTSNDDKYPFSARQLYYQVRPLTQKYTHDELTSEYFYKILVEYQHAHGPIKGLYYEPRGFLIEPHTGRKVPVGTREVADYVPPQFLYNKLLYVEKQGLVPIFEAAKLAQRFDIGILAGQGYAVGAAKDLLKHALENATQDIAVLCLHDCDVDGLMIAKTLARETPSRPNSRIDMIDLGLSVHEVMDLGLEAEEVTLRKMIPWELQENLTQKEIDFLTGGETYRDSEGKGYWIGKRVELNAFTSDQLISYIETKLKQHGLTEKVSPPDDVLESTAGEILEERLKDKVTDRVLELIPIQKMVEEISFTLEGEADLSSLPTFLKEELKNNPPLGWQDIVSDEVEAEVEKVVSENDDLIRDFCKNLGF